MVGVIIGILLLGSLIAIHEGGHLIAAKFFGVDVAEFSIGMGPKLIGRRWGGTEYNLRLIPFGGYCAMAGEEEESASPAALCNQPKFVRAVIYAAGPLFNLLTAVVLTFTIVFVAGANIPRVYAVTDGARTGIQVGDVITSVNGYQVSTGWDISIAILEKGLPKTNTVEFTRNGERLTAIYDAVENGYGYGLGFLASGERYQDVGFGTKLLYGAKETGSWFQYTISSVKYLLTGKVKVSELSGPVGVISEVSAVVEDGADIIREEGVKAGVSAVILQLGYFTILLSFNLGILNLLPIPALDGGRLFLVVLEAIRGRKLSQKVETGAILTCFVLLLGLMVFVMGQDIIRLVT